MSAPETVVIGTGADELACAHALARAGHRVLVLEQHAAHEAYEPGWVAPPVIEAFALNRHGLAIERADPWAAVPLDGGGRLELWHDVARTVEAIRRVSPADAAKWPAFCARMAECARILELLYQQPPPQPMSREPRELWRLAATAVRARRLGGKAVAEFLRLLPMPVADLLDDFFEHDALKATLAVAGVMDLAQGPRAGGTAFALLHRHAGSPQGVFRPARSNVRQVMSSMPGIEIRRDARVARIPVHEGRAAGVVLAGGEEIAAVRVVSGLDPRRTLGALLEEGWLDPALARAVRHIRSRGVAARIELAVGRDPGFSVLTVAPSLDYLERAHDDAKYERVSQAPWLEARSRTGADGQHRIDVHVQYAPHDAAGGWDEVRRDALGDLAMKLLAAHVPDLTAAVVERQVLVPPDLEARYGHPEGQASHAELALDQALWMRPAPEIAHYRTPVAGLYLCGPGTHPGAGVAGLAGLHAARAILEDIR